MITDADDEVIRSCTRTREGTDETDSSTRTIDLNQVKDHLVKVFGHLLSREELVNCKACYTVNISNLVLGSSPRHTQLFKRGWVGPGVRLQSIPLCKLMAFLQNSPPIACASCTHGNFVYYAVLCCGVVLLCWLVSLSSWMDTVCLQPQHNQTVV